MTVFGIIGWIWLLLGIICITVFRFYIGMTNQIIRKEYQFIGNLEIKNPLLVYYVSMVLIGAVILGYILIIEIQSRWFKGE